MAGIPKQIIQLLFGRERLEQIPLEDLKDLLDEYPSFNAGHLLLSKKLKMEGLDEFSHQTQRTALHFTNPFWLQFLLEKEANGSPQVDQALEVPTEKLKSEEEPVSFQTVSVFASHEDAGIREKTAVLFSESFADQSTSEQKIEHGSIIEDKTFTPHSWTEQDKERYDEPVHEIPSIQEKMQDPDELMEESLADIALSRVDEEANLDKDQIVMDKEAEPSTEDISISSVRYEEEIVIDENASSGAPAEDEVMENEYAGFRAESQDETWDTASSKDRAQVNQSEPAPGEQMESDLSHDDDSESVPEEPVFSGQESELEMPENKIEKSEQRTYYFWEKEFYTTRNINGPESLEKETPVSDFIGAAHEPSSSSEILEEKSESELAVEDSPAMKAEIPNENAEPAIVFEQDPIVLGPFVNVESEHADFAAAPEMVSEPDIVASHEIPKIKVDEPLEELQFTPYHTIDYFASQGIQYEQEENPTDKFGKQLKSFTAWLKSMKKLPKAVLESEMSEITEAAIQSIAEHSIEEKEVITEAMAEVLVLQGKTDKAIELYQKLSLLNPAKSAFFAARIDQIK
jgi:hypothetical protein